MKLFINAGVCERKWNNNVKFNTLANGCIRLRIPNYLEKQRIHEYVFFTLPKCKENDLKKDKLFKSIRLTVTSPNFLYHVYDNDANEEEMYALLRSTRAVTDDIFIPASMKDKVTVIQRIRFVDDEADYGEYLSNVYLIKIRLNKNESLPVYMGYENPYSLDFHYVFYKTDFEKGEYKVTRLLETYIKINESNKNEYVSLSSLCK